MPYFVFTGGVEKPYNTAKRRNMKYLLPNSTIAQINILLKSAIHVAHKRPLHVAHKSPPVLSHEAKAA